MEKEPTKWTSIICFIAAGFVFLTAIFWLASGKTMGSSSVVYGAIFFCLGVVMFFLGLATRRKPKTNGKGKRSIP